MKHQITMLVACGVEVEAETYEQAVGIIGEALKQPNAVTILGAEGYGIRMTGVQQTPPIELKPAAPPLTPQPSTPGRHDIEVHGVGVESGTRH